MMHIFGGSKACEPLKAPIRSIVMWAAHLMRAGRFAPRMPKLARASTGKGMPYLQHEQCAVQLQPGPLI